MQHGRMHGQGEFVWANKDTYRGSWVKGRMHGKGTKTMKNGDSYVGVSECFVFRELIFLNTLYK